MKVILLENVKGLGKKGDLVNAKDGHARNYLLPRGLAKEATEGSVKQLKEQKKAKKIRKDEEIKEAKKLAEKISNLTVEIKSRSGEGGRLFGSVTTKDIATALQKQHKIKIDKRKIYMNDNIKSLGITIVKVKVYTDITAELKVHVVEE
ncbi:50S ribosomal protein L9 [Clostridium sp. D2Q-14]|uniref:50S ribosomal protein L9 n=1 Tax=Anaeromonas gelatinilytica TaxID=2683194 RepID=UPI00193C32DE|nr:50S ribosomal protein L9 [Anaeromonas gelatinilytica]MBS4534416.1 50S ribosomal protein L9 [Anaeromonas gelatinilytica]